MTHEVIDPTRVGESLQGLADPTTRDRAAIWGGFALGLLATPLLVLAFAGMVAQWYGGFDVDVKRELAISTTRDIADAIDRYVTDHHRLPKQPAGLQALVPKYLARVPDDPWGHPFAFQTSAGTVWADVVSYGADGRPGGDGAGADISARFGWLGTRPPALLNVAGRVALCIVPLLAFLAALRWRWGEGLLAGTATLWATLLLATLGMAMRGITAALLPLIAGLLCMAGAVAVLRRLRGALPATCVAAMTASFILWYLITT
jgi:general secretion pathway protein G